MKFREHKNVFPKTLQASSHAGLDALLLEWGNKYEFVDLQFSTHPHVETRGGQLKYHTKYVALCLFKEREDVKV